MSDYILYITSRRLKGKTSAIHKYGIPKDNVFFRFWYNSRGGTKAKIILHASFSEVLSTYSFFFFKFGRFLLYHYFYIISCRFTTLDKEVIPDLRRERRETILL